MARRKLPDRVICIEDRECGELRFRLHLVVGGRRVARGYRTAEEAEAEAERFRRVTAHLHTATVESAIALYVEDMCSRGKWRRKAKAFASKTGALRRFLRPVADVPIGALTPAHITKCCRAWDTSARAGAWTRHLARVRVRAFLAWAVRKRLVKASPMTDEHATPRPRAAVRRLRLDDARRLRQVVDPAAARGEPSAVFVLAALVLGARTSELLSLTGRAFDDGGRVVTYQDAKEPDKTHRVLLPEALVEPMRALAELAGDGPLFVVRERHPQTWGARAVRHWAQVAGIAGWEEMDARWLRRTNNTLAVEARVSAEVVARETGRTLHVVRQHYVESGAETTGRAAAMDEATAVLIDGGIGTRTANLAK